MKKIIITTDSGSNPRDTSNMIPCIIIDSNNINYYDMKKVSTDSNIKVIKNIEAFKRSLLGEKFHTSSPNISDYISVMTPYLDNGYDVIHLSMSSGISAGSVNSSMVAADLLNTDYGENRITIIDTLTGGSGGTVINDYANSLLEKGLTKKEIIDELKDVRSKILTSFYISEVSGFINSGRGMLSNIALLSSKLSFHFRIDVNTNGILFPKPPILRGNIKTSFMKYLKTLINNTNIYEYDPNYFSLLITRLNNIDIEEVKDYINSFNYFDKSKVEEIEFYSAISSYGVIDQVGIGLIKKR